MRRLTGLAEMTRGSRTDLARFGGGGSDRTRPAAASTSFPGATVAMADPELTCTLPARLRTVTA